MRQELKDIEKRMGDAVAALKDKFKTLRTGRANLGLLDGITVSAYGTDVPINQVANLSVPDPTLIVYGDYIPLDSRWPKMHQNGVDFADKIKAAGGSVDIVELPKIGIRGNSHMLMMDKNNLEVAAVIQKWLADKGLVR